MRFWKRDNQFEVTAYRHFNASRRIKYRENVSWGLNIKLALLQIYFLQKWANPGLFCIFLSFSHYNFNNTNLKKCRWVVGIQIWCRRMVGADETTELWRSGQIYIFVRRWNVDSKLEHYANWTYLVLIQFICWCKFAKDN